MKITTNSHLLSSLTSLIDPSQRQQQQDLQDQKGLGRKQDKQASAQESAKVSHNANRQGLIEANREALKSLQDRLKADKLEKLKLKVSAEDLNGQTSGKAINPVLRENFSSSSRPANVRLGQIIDIKV